MVSDKRPWDSNAPLRDLGNGDRTLTVGKTHRVGIKLWAWRESSCWKEFQIHKPVTLTLFLISSILDSICLTNLPLGQFILYYDWHFVSIWLAEKMGEYSISGPNNFVATSTAARLTVAAKTSGQAVSSFEQIPSYVLVCIT